MAQWFHLEDSKQSLPARHPTSRHLASSCVPHQIQPWALDVTAAIRCLIQHQCSAATVEHRRSEQSLHSAAREVDIAVHYPAKCHEEFRAALNALGQHWSIHEATERPVYLIMLPWAERTCYVHIYDEGEHLSAHSGGS